MEKKNRKKAKFSLEEEYRKNRPMYERYTNKFEQLIKTLIDESTLSEHSITSRTKEIESFSRKVSDKAEEYNKFSDITDLSGVRICCYFSSQVDKVAEIINKNFVIIPELSVDKRETIDPETFGYLSLHYVVKLTDERAKLPEYNKYKDLLCEIQMRTILQHAWAEIEHDIGYKSAIETPRKIRRRFSRLAGLLELADEEFDSIKEQIEDYSLEIEKKIMTAPKEVAIDNISMKTYILTSPIVKKLDKRLAMILEFELRNEARTKFAVKMCNYFSIKTIQKLETLISSEKDNIIEFIKQLIKIRGKPLQRVVTRGLSLTYLAYVLITEQRDINPIIDYFKSMEIFSKIERQRIAAMLLAARKKIK